VKKKVLEGDLKTPQKSQAQGGWTNREKKKRLLGISSKGSDSEQRKRDRQKALNVA